MFFKINDGWRINLNEVIEYGVYQNDKTRVEITFKNGKATNYSQGSEEEAKAKVDELDEILLYHKPKGGFIE